MNNSVDVLLRLPNDDVIAGGGFTVAGGIPASRIARWIGSTWEPLGSGMNSSVSALIRLPNGDIIAGGGFTTAGGNAANRIARWNGVSWSPLGTGLGGSVNALARLPNGDIVAGGSFTTAGGAPASRIARWDGTAWSALGTGTASTVFALAVLGNGDLLVGGSFASAGGVAGTAWLARWDGSTWSPFATALNLSVNALAVLGNGDVIAAGRFTTAGGPPVGRIARWDGSTWVPYGAGADDDIGTIRVLGNGDVVIGGSFNSVGGVLWTAGIARWNGTAWQAIEHGLQNTEPPVQSLAELSNGDLWVGGSFAEVLVTEGGAYAGTNGLARVRAGRWMSVGRGPNFHVRALLALPNGEFLAGGAFVDAGGVKLSGSGEPVPFVGRWDGSRWHALGTQTFSGIPALARAPNGDVFAAHGFAVDRWDGTTWTTTSLFANGVVEALITLPNGHVLAGAYNTQGPCVYRYDGSNWTPAASGVSNARVFALAARTGGDLIAGGWIDTRNIVRSTDGGLNWSWAGSGANGGVYALLALPGGDLIAGGEFTTIDGVAANRIARWNGTTWSPLGTGTDAGVYALALLPNGDIVAAGDFNGAGGAPVFGIARWDGTNWSSLGTGLGGGSANRVLALAVQPDGTLAAGGEFRRLSPSPSAAPSGHFALWGCPVVEPYYHVFASGCAGSLGVATNVATAPPRLGQIMSVQVDNLPFSNAAVMIGFSNTMAAFGPLPFDMGLIGMTGCLARVSFDLNLAASGSGGTATFQLRIPNNTNLLAARFHTQCLVLDPGWNPLGIVASDAATAVVGQ